MKKHILSMALAMIMVLSLFPQVALAATPLSSTDLANSLNAMFKQAEYGGNGETSALTATVNGNIVTVAGDATFTWSLDFPDGDYADNVALIWNANVVSDTNSVFWVFRSWQDDFSFAYSNCSITGNICFYGTGNTITMTNVKLDGELQHHYDNTLVGTAEMHLSPFVNAEVNCTIAGVSYKTNLTLDFGVESNFNAPYTSFFGDNAYFGWFDANGDWIGQVNLTSKEVFREWNTEPDGSGDIYVSGKAYNISEDITIYAVWVGTVAVARNLDTASEWARADITAAVAKGFVHKDIQDNYKNVITRAEFCRMAVKFLEYKLGKDIDDILAEKGLSRNTNTFSDTTAPDILAAYALGITNGTTAPTATTPGTFTPNGEFNREQAATMIRNTCKAAGMDVSNITAAGFEDIGTASSWAVDGINFVRNNDIMIGTSTTPPLFSPKSTYTREQSILTFNNIK